MYMYVYTAPNLKVPEHELAICEGMYMLAWLYIILFLEFGPRFPDIQIVRVQAQEQEEKRSRIRSCWSILDTRR
jgi:hypothetical protein